MYLPVGSSVAKVPGLLAVIGCEVADFPVPLITSFTSLPVWFAVTKTTSIGAWVLIGGCEWFWFCGICCDFSGPTPITPGFTTMPPLPIVTLTRVGTAGRGSLGWLSAPQPAPTNAKISAASAPPPATLALPRTISA